MHVRATATADHMVRLAALECAASCILSALRLTGRNPDRLLLDYWSLGYVGNNLVGGRHVRLLNLEYLYGIRQQLAAGGAEDLEREARSGAPLLLLCRASRLAYFPEAMLTHDDDDFPHMVLVYDFDPGTGRLLFMDPIAGHIGAIGPRELAACSWRDGLYHYYRLELPEKPFAEPSPAHMLRTLSKRNLDLFLTATRQGGVKAIERFESHLRSSADWPAEARERWVRQNNVTLAALVKIRQAVWARYAGLGVLTDRQLAEGERRIGVIAGLWTGVNLSLLKWKLRPGDVRLAELIGGKLAELRQAEPEFLRWLYGIGCDAVDG